MPRIGSLWLFATSLVGAFAPAAHAQWWNYNDATPRKLWGTQWEPKLVYSRDIFDQVGPAVDVAIQNGHFDRLERMHDEFLRTGLRATDGSFMVEAIQARFEWGFSGVSEADATAMLAKWAAQAPGSKLRPVIEALMWQRLAWNARGGQYGSTVPGEAMQIFRERLGKAARALKASEQIGKESPIWYWVALIVAGSSGRPAAEQDALFEEAVTRFPHYQPLYYTRMNYLLPQWGGSYATVDRFIQASVVRTSEKDGKAFYAWLYVNAARKTEGDFLEVTQASWPQMKLAFEDMVARHPDSWNKNLYATFACRVRDKETTARLLTELADKASLGEDSPGITNESCRRFAFMKV